jgi:hypothetical protein
VAGNSAAGAREALRSARSFRIPVVAIGALCLLAVGCDRLSSDNPRQAWEETMEIRQARDYARLWDSLATLSKDQIAHVLEYVKTDPSYVSRLSEKFQITPAKLATMDAAEFFVSLMNGVELNHPHIVDLQMKNADGAKFLRTRIKEDRAVVTWVSGTGKEEQTFFLREAGRWRPVLQRP